MGIVGGTCQLDRQAVVTDGDISSSAVVNTALAVLLITLQTGQLKV